MAFFAVAFFAAAFFAVAFFAVAFFAVGFLPVLFLAGTVHLPALSRPRFASVIRAFEEASGQEARKHRRAAALAGVGASPEGRPPTTRTVSSAQSRGTSRAVLGE